MYFVMDSFKEVTLKFTRTGFALVQSVVLGKPNNIRLITNGLKTGKDSVFRERQATFWREAIGFVGQLLLEPREGNSGEIQLEPDATLSDLDGQDTCGQLSSNFKDVEKPVFESCGARELIKLAERKLS